MTVHNISFTESLLDKKVVYSVKEEPKVTTPPKTEEKPDEFVSSKEEQEVQEKPNHKVRNWAIGITSAVTLAGFVLAGRTGKLGKGIQKFLGGAEKEVNHVTGHSNPHVTTKEPPVSKKEESQIIKTEDTPTPKSEDSPTAIVEDPPKPKAADTSVPEAKKTQTQKTEELSAEGLTKKQAELNAKLNRVPPNIDKELLHSDFPDVEEFQKLLRELGIDFKEIEKIELSEYKRNGDGILYTGTLKNRRLYQITRSRKKPNKITKIYINTGKIDYYVNYHDNGSIREMYQLINTEKSFDYLKYYFKNTGEKEKIIKEINNSKYEYDSKGCLIRLVEDSDVETDLHREIYFHANGKGNVERIEHFKEYDYLKTDYFGEKGNFVNEAFPLNIDW